jgi:RNA polymerase sigma-70 factor (ECF subfamily)
VSDWPETRASLIQQAQGMDNEAAWQELVAIYQPVVYRMARRGGLTHEAAEDVVQTVWLSISKALPGWEYREDGPRFRNWLGKVTKNAVINALTRARPDRASGSSSVTSLLQNIPESESVIRTFERESRLELIRYASGLVRNEFSEKTWEIFLATCTTGLSSEEVARQLACSISSVYVSRCRVIARLRAKVRELSFIERDDV